MTRQKNKAEYRDERAADPEDEWDVRRSRTDVRRRSGNTGNHRRGRRRNRQKARIRFLASMLGTLLGAILLVLVAYTALNLFCGFGKVNAQKLREQGYPESLIALVERNPETKDFVLDYPKKHKNAAAKSIGDDVVTGEIPALIQWDERWGYAPYGSETIIAVSGCGPTALSMVISGLLQDASITPAVVADYASSNGYLDENLDTKWELMTNGVEHFGISGSILGLDENAMINVLSVGCPIICSMGPGIFTTTGHFIVLTGYQDGAFTVHDPASKVRTSQTYTFQEISGQIKNMWYFAKN